MRGGGNMNKMMKQMQKMQKDMLKAQEELQEMTFEATAGGGMVKVVANGKKEITDIEIKEEVVLKEVEDKTNDTMGKFTKGLNLPGGMF